MTVCGNRTSEFLVEKSYKYWFFNANEPRKDERIIKLLEKCIEKVGNNSYVKPNLSIEHLTSSWTSCCTNQFYCPISSSYFYSTQVHINHDFCHDALNFNFTVAFFTPYFYKYLIRCDFWCYFSKFVQFWLFTCSYVFV